LAWPFCPVKQFIEGERVRKSAVVVQMDNGTSISAYTLTQQYNSISDSALNSSASG
jgi:hypothetical protein